MENTSFAEGLGASIRVGFEAIGDDLDGALVALGDMPGCAPSTSTRS